MTKRVKLVISIGDRRLILEGDFVRAEVVDGSSSVEEELDTPRQHAPPAIDAQVRLSEEKLVAEKGPRGHSEMVAVLAYSLQQSGVVEFTADDIKRAYSRARQRPPKVIAQALRDAKNKYDFVEPGKKKGTFRLSTHGERTVVFDLPRKRTEKA